MGDRREFLKRALNVSVVAGAAATAAMGATKLMDANEQNLVQGKSAKKEVLYWESEAWKKYYKVAY